MARKKTARKPRSSRAEAVEAVEEVEATEESQSATPAGKMHSVMVRLDEARYIKLRVLCAKTLRSASEVVAEILDTVEE